MPRGVNRSGLNRTQRLERAFAYFDKGYGNADVTRILKISRETTRKYRRLYEEDIQTRVSENPRMLTDVLGNTIRVIGEIDLVRKDAWARLDDDKRKRSHRCPECGCHHRLAANEATAFQKVILDAADKRMRLFGLLGVKQEYFIHVQRIQLLQTKIIQFLETELCDEDRRKFEQFLQREVMSSTDDAMEVEAHELISADAST